ncbi:MAG: SUMF1/EgtB/PvdO family nonheme iron enzyme [Nitrospinota bacterium]|nr:SUMF1/EgtB/PvdO family nonheme iron enzyme [Nitrospinota bacterium]
MTPNLRLFRWLLMLAAVLWFSLEAAGSLPQQESDAEMILIPAGPFMMGSSEEDIEWAMQEFYAESKEWYQSETPAQAAFLPSYHIDKYEVTVAQYKKYLEMTGNPPPKDFDNPKFNQPKHPVVGVTWKEAQNYCRSLGKRLPTEAEWEKAARGSDGRRYPWGNTSDQNKANARGKQDNHRYTAPIGKFPDGQSPYGVMDMAGNAWEWTKDWYGPYHGNDQKSELFGEKFKVIRGGSWNSNMDLARSALRGKSLPDKGYNYIGFRCVQEATSSRKN